MSDPQIRLDGVVAVVTGARQGMGARFSTRLAEAGARVACVDRVMDDELRTVAAAAGGVAFGADCSDPAALASLAADVERELGAAGIVVSNHAYMTMGLIEEHDEADWWKVVDTNLGGTFFLLQAFLPQLRARAATGAQAKAIVMASEWGVIGWPEATAYAASKAGLISLVKTLGRELGPEGIAVNAIAPGVTDTPQLQVDADAAGITLDAMKAEYATAIPLGRIATPDDIADALLFLANPNVRSLVGQVIQVNGGSTRSRS